MRHVLIFAIALIALVALSVYQDRREIAERATGKRAFEPALLGCGSILIASAIYALVAIWSRSIVLAFMTAVATPVLLVLLTSGVRAVLHQVAPRRFPQSPPPMAAPTQVQSADPSSVPALARPAFGRPAPKFELIGTWLSCRGNFRNTAWTPAPGPREPRLAWRWDVAPEPPEYRYTINGAPVVDIGGRVFLGTSHGLVALGPDGSRLWTLGSENAAIPALDPNGDVACAFRERLVVASAAGEPTWIECPALDPVAVTVAHDGAILVTCRGTADLDSGRLIAFTPRGDRNWAAPCLRHAEYPPAVSPAGAVFLSSNDTIVWNSDDPSASYDRLQEFTADGKEVRRTDASDEGDGNVWSATAAISLEDGTVLAGIGNGIRIGTAMLAHGGWGPLALDPRGTLYVGGRALVALDLAAGTRKWSVDLGGAGLPVVDGEGTVYAACAGHVAAISSRGEPLWRWDMPPDRDGHRDTIIGLAIGPGRVLYVATSRTLYAIRS